MLLRVLPLVFVALWSTGYIAMKFAAPYVDPLSFLFVRFALVVMLIAPFVFWRTDWQVPGRVFAAGFGIGMVLHGIYLGGVFWALKRGMPAGVVAVLVSMQPLLSASIFAPIFAERVERRHWAGLLIGLAGCILVLTPRLEVSFQTFDVTSLVVCSLAVFSLAIGLALQKVLLSDVPIQGHLVPQYLGAAVVVGVGAVLLEERTIAWSWPVVGALLWLVIVLSVGAISIFLFLLKRNEVWRTSMLFYLIPPFTAGIAWLMFDETMTTNQLTGVALVAVAMLLARPRAVGAKT